MSPHPDDPDDRETRFRRLYATYVDTVLGYALRRCDRPEDAADVVAETFLVAWRRVGSVPAGPEARLWLYGVARRVLANQRRGDQRRVALGARLRDELPRSVPDHAGPVAERARLAAAVATLGARDREVLELAVHEELEPHEIAVVLDLSPVAARARLSRARRRLRYALHETADPPDHDRQPVRQPVLVPPLSSVRPVLQEKP